MEPRYPSGALNSAVRLGRDARVVRNCSQLGRPFGKDNIPLNNELQKLDPGTMSESMRKRAGRLQAPLESMERNQDSVREPDVHSYGDSALQNVTRHRSRSTAVVTSSGTLRESVRV